MVQINESAGGSEMKLVKATPISPVYAMFDIVEIEGKQFISGSVGFVDQFGMERMAKTTSAKGIQNLGQHVLAIFNGQVDITEPDEFTKEKLAKELDAERESAKMKLIEAYRGSNNNEGNPNA